MAKKTISKKASKKAGAGKINARKVRKKTGARRASSRKASPAKKSEREVNWVAALHLSIFLGFFGVDRFYMGMIGTGILKLLITVLTFGIFGWIWWLIDIILITTKHPYPEIIWLE